jgi:hypothetical protein
MVKALKCIICRFHPSGYFRTSLCENCFKEALKEKLENE